MCVCVRVCVCERERERVKDSRCERVTVWMTERKRQGLRAS